MASPTSGGFVRNEMPTPPASSVTSSTVMNPLPHPRRHPLRAGGSKESAIIQYLDQHIMKYKRRWAKRQSKNDDAGEAEGYQSFTEAATDLDDLIDVVWVSGTPKIQIAYLLNVAFTVVEFLPSFPPAPRTTFRLLDKLDQAFSSLLQGRDLDSSEPLSGFENGSLITTMEKVRIKSVADRTRITVVNVMSQDVERDEADNEVMETDDEDMDIDDDDYAVDAGWEMSVGTVYERTINELGQSLGGPPIGIITDD